MGEALKVLGQLDVPATSRTAVYTVPASTQATLSTIVIANRTSGSITFRIGVAVANEAEHVKQWLFYDVTLTKNNTFTATLGITLGATDVIYAYASATGLSVNVFGVEVT